MLTLLYRFYLWVLSKRAQVAPVTTKEAVLDFLFDGPATAEEIALELNLNYHSVRDALTDLAKSGMVGKTGMTRATTKGGKAAVWEDK